MISLLNSRRRGYRDHKRQSNPGGSSLVMAVLFLLSVSTGCNNTAIRSEWVEDIVTIDGDPVEWQNCLYYHSKRNTAVGFMNDGQDLFLCILSYDRELIMQMQNGGFTIWFGHGKRNDSRTGIRFLAGNKPEVAPPGERGNGFGNHSEHQPPEMENAFRNVEVLGSDSGPSTMFTTTTAIASGIYFKMTPGREPLVFEMSIPLHKDVSGMISLGIEKDTIIDVVIESTVPDLPQRRGPPPGRGQPSGFGGGSGGPPGGGFSGHGGGDGPPPGGAMRGGPPGGGHHGMQLPEQVKIKMRVLLASGTPERN
ncbi:MAG: hypothetical protein JW863_04285 [Chitinispirillaceae bacterium]|nr:hypothetical protein [Chitinispirillaceae bacterium]